jgi:hypothetical protein
MLQANFIQMSPVTCVLCVFLKCTCLRQMLHSLCIAPTTVLKPQSCCSLHWGHGASAAWTCNTHSFVMLPHLSWAYAKALAYYMYNSPHMLLYGCILTYELPCTHGSRVHSRWHAYEYAHNIHGHSKHTCAMCTCAHSVSIHMYGMLNFICTHWCQLANYIIFWPAQAACSVCALSKCTICKTSATWTSWQYTILAT